mmetsp:Transcript_170519/g.546933  ORF Transcript_170519/g.546933 Transcript_170519/m.546933 type:complete len:206 (-) Transcript_170519:881-1498(-)
MAKYPSHVGAADKAILIPIEDGECDSTEILVASQADRQHNRKKGTIADVAIAIHVHRLEDVVEVFGDGDPSKSEVVLQHRDGELAVAIQVQQAEGHAHGLELGHTDVAEVGHRQPHAALEQRLLRHGAEGLDEVLANRKDLLMQWVQLHRFMVVGGEVEAVVQRLADGGPRVAVVLQHHGEQLLGLRRKAVGLSCLVERLLQYAA